MLGLCTETLHTLAKNVAEWGSDHRDDADGMAIHAEGVFAGTAVRGMMLRILSSWFNSIDFCLVCV